MNQPDDLLARSTRALRDATAPDQETDLAHGVAATTLARVERSARSNRVVKLRRRAYTRWVVMPMAASFLVFAAWASASGRLSGWMGLRAHDEDERATRSAPSHDPAPAARALATQAATVIAPTPTVIKATPDPWPSVTASEAPAPHAPSAKAVPAAAPKPDVDALYRDAHDAHFVRRDPAVALAAWDRYLASAGPSGRFALEARYNRAISLVRLGRREEAKAALRPFASGEYGGYRRDEATKLLGTLE